MNSHFFTAPFLLLKVTSDWSLGIRDKGFGSRARQIILAPLVSLEMASH